MNTAQPIRKTEDLQKIKDYYRYRFPNCRNEMLIIIGLNTALRISDMLSLRWNMVYDFSKNEYQTHIVLREKKTGKISRIYINHNITEALSRYRQKRMEEEKPVEPDEFLFGHGSKNTPISRVQAFRIIKRAAQDCSIQGNICCHSLRKTFGYHAWRQGVSPALLMNIFNHSSYQVTKRYLGIEQDDRDQIFQQIYL